MIKMFEECIHAHYPELEAFNFRLEMIDEILRYVFQTNIEDFYTIALLVDSDCNIKEFKTYIKDFIEEFKEVLEQEHYCKHCDEALGDCECSESESSVAAGLGFVIDDDGHWIPNDDNFSFGYSYPEEYSLTIDDGKEIDVREYMYFMVMLDL